MPILNSIDTVLRVSVDGRKQVSSLLYEKQINVKTKVEQTLAISQTTGLVPVYAGTIDDLAVIIVTVAPEEGDTALRKATLTLAIDNTIDPPYTIELPFEEILVYKMGTDFSQYITGASISTSETTSTRISFSAYSA